ncbi:ATPase, V1/A1 complex, subunit E [Radiomyces spectabilis]|uniref:ATPase, V1/A1 complex, subunit E n=1 Tax=Radiomyces spectabilis TaxID=64574 RepID=UPI00221F512E|nr:ATPase, V1/A1 complex, subunit E [Radiomyces spectabilis]KAI8370724.1 ATPase, V1/A1 complex, subunit E [Radiomyces spectabilis]
MTSVRPLNDDEVFNEMKKMVAFIKQEALEKAREIKVKADEEFNIEKAKIVRQESLNIEAVFERKIKQAEVQKRIAQSNHINKARLRILQQRQQGLDDLFEETNSRIHEIHKDEEKYATLLENLLLQGAYTLMEPEMAVTCREADVDNVRFAAEAVSQKYEQTLGQPVTITVNEDYLPASSAGGVIVTGLNGKIVVDNTLEARLNIVKEEMLPQVRVILFGHSPNRKFFN